jgi:hypothetical protein
VRSLFVITSSPLRASRSLQDQHQGESPQPGPQIPHQVDR